MRSPDYPAIGLKEAIEKVRLVWNRDYQNKLPKQVMAEHMGYKGLSGASLPVLSALGKYGLIEGRADETRVSDLAVEILAHEPGTPERSSAISRAAAAPELFFELAGKFPEKVSDAALRSYLLTQKFTQPAADAAIRAYRDTLKLVDEEAAPDYPQASFKEHGHMQPQQEPKGGWHGLSPANPRSPDRQVLSQEPPFRVSLTPGALEVLACIKDEASADQLIRAISAWKVLLRQAGTGIHPSPRIDHTSPLDPSPETEAAHAQATGVSFMITQAQKARLREAGFGDEQIREMTPTEAHELLRTAS